MNLAFKLSCLLFVVFFTSSCEDDAPTKSEFLTGKSWNIVSIDIDFDNDGSYEFKLFPSIDPTVEPPCDSDDVWEFTQDGEICIQTNSNHCHFLEPGFMCSATWEIDELKDVIYTQKIEGDYFYYPDSEMIIFKISETVLELGWEVQTSFGQRMTRLQMTSS